MRVIFRARYKMVCFVIIGRRSKLAMMFYCFLCQSSTGKPEKGCRVEKGKIEMENRNGKSRKTGGAGETRTPDLVFRKHLLYPAELQPRVKPVYHGVIYAENVVSE